MPSFLSSALEKLLRSMRQLLELGLYVVGLHAVEEGLKATLKPRDALLKSARPFPLALKLRLKEVLLGLEPINILMSES